MCFGINGDDDLVTTCTLQIDKIIAINFDFGNVEGWTFIWFIIGTNRV